MRRLSSPIRVLPDVGRWRLRGRPRKALTPRTEGGRLLVEALRLLTFAEAAQMIGVRAPTVWRWAVGRRAPRYAARVVMRQLLHIPLGAWDSYGNRWQ